MSSFRPRCCAPCKRGEIMRIGDNKVIPINVRIIAATNKNPLEAIKAGRLRADLFYRLNVLDLKIPPLRDRKGDPELLFGRFLEKACHLQTIPVPPPVWQIAQGIAPP